MGKFWLTTKRLEMKSEIRGKIWTRPDRRVCGDESWVRFLSPFTKAELPQEGISFCTQFPSLGIFINKKVGFRKN